MDYGGPYEIEGSGEYPKDGLWNSPRKYRLTAKYPDEVTMIIAGGHDDICGGTKWIGEDGWVWITRGNIDAQPKKLLEEKFGPDGYACFVRPDIGATSSTVSKAVRLR